MQVDAGPGFTDLGIIGEKAPLAPDRQQTTKYRTPTTLSRSSLPTQAPVIQRTSAAVPGTPGSPSTDAAAPTRTARPALARVSAHDFPNLSRASQLSTGSTNAQQRTNLRRSSIVKTEQELARRAAGPVDVGMTICITDVESSKAITYKSDGSRFAGSKHTVKMVAGHTYRFVMSLNEEYKFVDETCILTYTSSKGQLVKEPLECEQTDRGFTADWTCTADACKNGDRNSMELCLPLEDFGQCRLPLVVKVYDSKKERAVAAGVHLKSIILTYRVENGEVKIRKEAWVDH